MKSKPNDKNINKDMTNKTPDPKTSGNKDFELAKEIAFKQYDKTLEKLSKS